MQGMDSQARLKDLIRELFQLDVADLDFGLYRLFHLKRDEVEAFLNKQLPAEVVRAFDAAAGAEREALQRRVDHLADRARASVADDAILPSGEPNPAHAAAKAVTEYVEARNRLHAVEASEAQRSEVFNLLYAFFSRYYDEGDFIPRRFYGARAAYAVPYSGEEVVLHWANKDQHYVKTGEAFRDYAFAVSTVRGEYRVRFMLVEATAAKDNTKGDTRFFFPLPKEATFDKAARTFTVPFHYRLPTEAEVARYGKNAKAQQAILDETAPKILEAVTDEFLRSALSAPSPSGRPAEGEEPPTLLRRRLSHFTKKNTTDYFVHKDLGAFLRQELEFFVRDQVVHEADLEGDFDAKRRTIRVFRRLAETLITFLAQVEDAQKRLFEKKKFVLRTDYLVPIQNVPRALWPEVLANKVQIAEWKKLYALEPKSDLFNTKGKVNEHVLERHRTLVVGTQHFDAGFTARLLEAMGDVDAQTDGLLLHSENFQALSLMQRRYEEQVKCIYIDPPYNTGTDGFPYKDGYKDSTWMSMISGRMSVATSLLQREGLFFASIDDIEVHHLRRICDEWFGSQSFIGTLTWIATTQPDNIGRARFGLQQNVEYVLLHSKCPRIQLPPFILRGSGKSRAYPHMGRFGPCRFEIIERAFEGAYARPTMQFTILGQSPREGKQWQIGEATARELEAAGKVEIVDGIVKRAVYPEDEEGGEVGLVPFWAHLEGVGTSQSGKRELTNILGRGHGLDTVKPMSLLTELASHVAANGSFLDYFAGSGTTGHAVINLNREDGGRRKFILVEMGDYFDTVLLPRIQKVMFAPEWKDGKPARLPTKDQAERTPRLVKVLRLESYEDALHNTFSDKAVERIAEREKAHREAVGEEEYRIRYLVKLPLEAGDSTLNLAKLEHPFDYMLEVLTDQGPKTETVDLVETFNWLYGLRVQRLLTWVNAEDKASKEKAGRSYRAVVASDREGKKRILVVWRDMKGLDPKVERPFLEAKTKELGPFEEQWINGDTAAMGFASLDGLFKRLMEAGER